MDTKALRELYKETYSKYPSPNAKNSLLLARLKTEGVDVSQFEELPEGVPKQEVPVKKETKEEVPVKKEAPKVKEAITDEGPTYEGQPVSKGRGVRTRYMVFFHGKVRYWTNASIQSMSSQKEHIKFPDNTNFDGVASFNKCKSC